MGGGIAHSHAGLRRIAAQVVSRIGFLGAATILLRQDTIRGLTTAASLCDSGAVRARRTWSLVLLDRGADTAVETSEAALREMPLTVQTLTLLPGQRADEQEMQVLLTRIPQSELVAVTRRIAGIDGVRKVTLGER